MRRFNRRAKNPSSPPGFQKSTPASDAPQTLRAFAEQVLAQKRRDFEKEVEKLDRAYAALPLEFQIRFDRFRRNNQEFRWRHEPYEMMISEQSIRLAQELQTVQAIEAFVKLSPREMRALVPTLSWDTHTPKSFAWTVQLAHTWLTDSEQIKDECAALCPMIGCEGTGCGMGRYTLRQPAPKPLS